MFLLPLRDPNPRTPGDLSYRLAAVFDVEHIAKKIQPVERADPKLLARLIADLDSADFTTRDKATDALRELGPQATAVLREAALRSRAVGGGLGGELVSEFTRNDLTQRDVCERRARGGFDERTMAQPQLAHAPGNDVDQQLLIRDH